MTPYIPLAIIALALVSLRVYNYVSGENLLQDAVRAFRIRRADLAALDRAAALEPSRSNIIVSLTSVPNRLPHISETLKSLLLQTRLPREIRLNLPEFCIRENRAYEIPPWLRGLDCVRIHRCDDVGPATKYMTTLQAVDSDQLILIVDDDRIYPARLIEDLERAAQAQPDAAIGTGGWIVPRNLVDHPTNYARFFPGPPAPVLGTMIKKPCEVDILKGVCGYAVRPRFFDLVLLADTSPAPCEAFFTDDIWLSGHCKVRKIVIPTRYGDFAPKRLTAHFQATSLGRMDADKRKNTATLQYFHPSCWRVGGPRNPA